MSEVKNEISTYFGRCRCCLSYGYLKNMWTEHQFEGEAEIYGEMLVECFALSWDHSEESVEHDQICEQCVNRLRDACDFKKIILNSQEDFFQEMGDDKESILKMEDCDEEFLMVYKGPESDTNDTADTADIDASVDETEYEDVEYLDDEVVGEAKETLVAGSSKATSEPQKTRRRKLETQADSDDGSKRKWPKRLPKSERFKTYKQYTEENLRQCLEAVRNGEITPNEAARKYNIPKKTICAKMRLEPKDVVNTTNDTFSNVTNIDSENDLPPIRNVSETPVSNTTPYKDKYLMIKHKNNLRMILMYSNASVFEVTSGSDYSCCVCNSQFTPESLKIHMSLHDDVIEHAMKGGNVANLNIYLDVTNLKCKLCDRDMYSLEALIQHLQNLHKKTFYTDIDNHFIPFQFETEKLECAVCSKEFEKFTKLRDHMSEHYRNYEYNFDQSSTDFYCKNNDLKMSDLSKHKNNIKVFLLYSNATMFRPHYSTGFACCFCGIHLPPIELKKHTLAHGDVSDEASKIKTISRLIIRVDITGLKCRLCKKLIDNLDTFMNHLRIEHKKNIYTDINNHIIPFRFDTENILCAVCKKKFRTYGFLRDHMAEHYRNYVCERCQRPFIFKLALDTHNCKAQIKEYSMANQLLNCGYCDEKFLSLDRLREHEVTHGKDLPFFYDNCDLPKDRVTVNRTGRLSLLKPGTVTQTCIPRFSPSDRVKTTIECKYCNSSFGTQLALNIHMRIHNAEAEASDFFQLKSLSTGL